MEQWDWTAFVTLSILLLGAIVSLFGFGWSNLGKRIDAKVNGSLCDQRYKELKENLDRIEQSQIGQGKKLNRIDRVMVGVATKLNVNIEFEVREE